jgi:hypothetical protein
MRGWHSDFIKIVGWGDFFDAKASRKQIQIKVFHYLMFSK